MGLLKNVISTAVVVAAGAAVIGKISQDKKKKAELDEFLVPDQEEPVVHDIPDSDDLSDAIRIMKEKPGKATFVFHVESTEAAHQLQEQAANHHMGSSYAEPDQLVEILYQSDVDDGDIDSLQDMAAMDGVDFVKAISE
ncbi:hypothetical protein [Catenisphaera adipataccumulans]|jgi:hypothetical protein|uniref:Uncharacterized protein n=1 Tax=Catenisphaera adipataccumulans TaxID=700500 RepID=A0A7W8FW76_9FIRM|nr:hypothetical protein [Catenisphaera adipataccumulans]MBB5183938.1 hypothetical protein [Catenisphaera adipataccumulans]